MNYAVVWLPAAEEELAAIWVASHRRSELARASTALDRRLSINPAAQGESRPNGRRITFEHPLAATFRIYEDVATVVVSQVWEFQ